MDILHTIAIDNWQGPFPAETQTAACSALERGKVLFLPHLAFAFAENERFLLSPEISDGGAKNVSLRPSGVLGGTSCAGRQGEILRAMMERFAQAATDFVGRLLPAYAIAIERAPTSYRPVEISGRAASPIHDDTRLHVDAFPSRPMRGRRIMRLFSNVNPAHTARIWHVGEPFEDMARKFLPGAQEGSALHAWLLGMLGITRGRRSAYDNLMLGLHDCAKLDETYQRNSPQMEVTFPPGSTWICYTDQVMHAALAGQYVLEQTFHLDVAAMTEPQLSPLKTLERLRGRTLV
jgi:hypothetical protein